MATATLMGLGAAFVLSALVLMSDHDHVAIGGEALAVSAAVCLLPISPARRDRRAAQPFHVTGESACYLVQVSGAIVFITGHVAGLYMICVVIAVNFSFLLSAAGASSSAWR